MFPAAPSGRTRPSSSRILTSTPGNGLPMPGAAGVKGPAGGQAGPGDETQLGGAVVLEDGGVRRPPPGRLQRARIQFGTGTDNGFHARGVNAAGQPALTEQAQHGGDQNEAGDAVVADGGVDVAHVEGLQRVELGAGVKAFGEGIKVQAGCERSRSERLIVLAEAEKLHGGLKGLLPGAAGPGECLGHGRGAGGQADQEGRRRIPVGQLQPPPVPRRGRASFSSRSQQPDNLGQHRLRAMTDPGRRTAVRPPRQRRRRRRTAWSSVRRARRRGRCWWRRRPPLRRGARPS